MHHPIQPVVQTLLTENIHLDHKIVHRQHDFFVVVNNKYVVLHVHLYNVSEDKIGCENIQLDMMIVMNNDMLTYLSVETKYPVEIK